MRRVYRQRQKITTGVFRGAVFTAVLAAAVCIWAALPAGVLRALSVRIIQNSQPSVIKYAIHRETPRMNLFERLLSPQLVGYSFETAASGARNAARTVEEGAGESAGKSAEEGVDESTKESAGESVKEAQTGGSLLLTVGAESQMDLLQENIYGQTGTEATDSEQDSDSAASGLTVFDGLTQEDTAEFFSPVKLKTYNLADYDSFEALIKEFYVVDSSTQATASVINLESLTSYDCTICQEDAAPQILIYHSHSQETYIDSDADDPSTTIVGVGGYLTQLLESYGYSVLHHEGTYDVPSRDDAYSKALPAIEALLEEYPSIEVVIDLHRDAVAEGTKLVYTYEGKDYARFMFFNGISRTASGPIEYLYNENLEANLAFSFQAEVVAESYFPGITRGIYLKAWRYNMHLMPKYMLIELGAQTNTVEEAMNTCEILAFVLDQVLSGGD